MIRSRLVVAAVVVGSFLALDAGMAGAADPTYPTGSFAVAKTTAYVLHGDYESPEVAFVPVSRLSLHDDTTPADQLAVVLYPDEGADGQPWTWSPDYDKARIVYGGGDILDPQPWADINGVHHPYVTITDTDGHTTRVDLPAVTLVDDRTPPVSRVTWPKKRVRHTIRAWRFIHGTTTDTGVGPNDTYVTVMQKRHGRYWVYRGVTRKWQKGKRTAAATLHALRNFVDTPLVQASPSHWRTKYIRGLTRGRLVVWVQSLDIELNMNHPHIAASVTLTRRR
jgi:hypothetical protein